MRLLGQREETYLNERIAPRRSGLVAFSQHIITAMAKETNFFYNDSTGTQQGPVSREELQVLADQGKISPQTQLKTEKGRNGTAGQISGLFPPKQTDSDVKPRPEQTKPEGYFYYDSQTAEKKGPYNQQELKSLAEKKTIKKDTLIETQNGETVTAGSVTWIWERDFTIDGKDWYRILRQERIRNIAVRTVLALLAVFAVVFAFQWLFSGSSFEITKPTSGLIAKADKGNPRACVQLINYYMIDESLAKLAAAASENEIGMAFESEIEKIVKKIREYARKGAKGDKGDGNNPYTQICKGYSDLAAMNDSGNSMEDKKDNMERALKAFCKAAEADNSEGSDEGAVVFAFLVNMVLTSPIIEIEDAKKYREQAEEHLIKAAERGHARAQLLLGLFYAVGSKIGITNDDKEAITWIYKAAAQRNALLNNAALGCAAAFLEDADAKKAFSLLYKRASGGWLGLVYTRKPAKEALPNLAVLRFFIASAYNDGIGGVKENKARAFEWYKKAAETDAIKFITTDAQFHIAQAYDNGEGVSEDKAAAFKQYLKAADAGNIRAQCRVAEMYDEGEGVKEDRDEAKKRFRDIRGSRAISAPLDMPKIVPGTLPKALIKKIEDELQRSRIAIEKASKKAG